MLSRDARLESLEGAVNLVVCLAAMGALRCGVRTAILASDFAFNEVGIADPGIALAALGLVAATFGELLFGRLGCRLHPRIILSPPSNGNDSAPRPLTERAP